ncbi:AAA family ATPase [Mucilaginibacter sp. BJC16-A38]|uniref:AAA family ATPase n=1 Tax=Mucilaginibacter phenanthrenivorans TaxID=1234842 RepID=UPI002157D085|nr:AAA family ATPase [Mucilaginibacter phenanthrenivorans]MCR8556910.1 AAA family ATPase [Mucilaginibacter phenanthrenivorans]
MPLIEIQFPKHAKFASQNKIIVAQPAKDKGAITIICGKNHSGKSYILKRVHRIVLKRNDLLSSTDQPIDRENSDDIFCNFSQAEAQIAPAMLITKISLITDLSKGTSTAQESNHKNVNRHYKGMSDLYIRAEIKKCLEDITFEFIEHLFGKLKKGFDSEKWRDPLETDYRLGILNGLLNQEIYLAPRSNPIVVLFEKLTQGRLYFGFSKPQKSLPLFEMHLIFTGQIIIPYASWSEGQKVLMSLLLLVHYENPALLLFDEIENHLHPEYISAVLDFVKKRVPQTIITTHHPHIIFSVYADVVNYLDLEKSNDEFPDIIQNDKHSRFTPPKRTCQLLEKSYAKLLSSYKLFDAYDNQLLRISAANIANLNELLTATFTSLFNYEVIGADSGKKPDLQSQKLYDLFRNRLITRPVKVLEIGAGEGRLLVDVNKILKVNETDRLTWCLYEPNEEPRKKIAHVLATFPYPEMVSVVDTLPDGEFDFIVIANVFHETPPDQIAEILSYCYTAIKKDGNIIIAELYPLLKPEQFAVPLSALEWAQLARKLGFKATTENIVFRNASNEAYFVQLTKNENQDVGVETLKTKIVEFWNSDVLANRSGDYAGRIRLGDSEEIPKTLGGLATMASVIAYNQGDWTA